MGPYKYGDPIKSDNSNGWLVLRESDKDAPNFYLTRNWRDFVPVSNIQPQKEYNWMTSELVTWRLPNGRLNQGILYKPENFEPLKKYPLITHYYEERSDELYEFKKPEPIRDFINIPYFVSRGYLIFVPDIYYELGEPGQSALKTVLSGVRYLCLNQWIDSGRLGLQGHSFGGWETNYIITHTHLFAAAEEGSGMTDLIGSYGDILDGRSRLFYYEAHQGRIRSSLWERPSLYIEESPIFSADQVTTPLLMMHNKRDKLVSWMQGVEFFTALRRLRKKAWMLQYDYGSHAVDGNDAIDYTIRMTQFFDHFLMGKPAPKWMTEGIPAKMKGIELGYDIDEASKAP